MMKSMLDGLPIHSLRSFAQCKPGELEQIYEEIQRKKNKALGAGTLSACFEYGH